ncbi:MAG TPA: lipid II flippase MurJ [Terriglobia bacterium]|nr:lipid II flippase MurJ [Terriglobia bacterium]
MASKRQIFRRSILVSSFSLLGGVAGIVVEMSIAARLGLSKGSDTYYVAYTIPYVITNLLAATSQYSLVPFFGALDARQTPGDLWRGFSYALNMFALGLGGIALVGLAAAPWVIRGIAPGFTPPQAMLATHLTRWLFPIIVPAGVAEVFRSFLYSQRRFALSSAAGFFTNAVVIASVMGTFHLLGYYSIVMGYYLGYFLSFTIMGAQILFSFPARYSFELRGSGEAFRNLHGAGTAQLGGALVWQGTVVVERIIASFLPAGTLTALGYGLKIMSALSDLLAGSVATVAFPALSRAVAHKARAEERKIFRDTLEISLVLVLTGVILCVLLNHNIIRLVFERGNFTPESTRLLATVFFYYSLALLPYAFARVFTFCLFARHESGTYIRFATFLYGLTVIFDLIYVAGLGWGARGIPMGLLTACTIASALAYQRNIANLKIVFDRSLGWFALKNILSGSMAALAILGLRLYIPYPLTSGANFLYLCELCGAGTLAFFVFLAATRAVPWGEIVAEFRGTGD